MKTEVFIVPGNVYPTVEMDSDAGAAYIRFRRAKVSRTVPRPVKGAFFAIDLDRNNEVIGIEVIGPAKIQISAVLEKTQVKAPNLDYSRTRFTSRPLALESV